MEFNVKCWKNYGWKKRKLIIREDKGDFQIKEEKQQKNKKQKEDIIQTYSLHNALIIDQTKGNDIDILITTKDYKQYIKPFTFEDKNTIIQKTEDIIKKITIKNAYKEYNDKVASYNTGDNDLDAHDDLCCKLFLFNNLMKEMNQQMEDFKNLVKPKPKSKTESGTKIIYNNINAIKVEMEHNFEEILKCLNKYFDLNEKFKKASQSLNSFLISKVKVEPLKEEGNKKEKEINENSSDEDHNEIIKKDNNENIENNNIINEEKNENLNNNNSQYKFLSYNKNDFKNELYNYKKRKQYNKSIIFPQNIVKEMIQTMTQHKPAPVYFNEPLSMCQRQYEKFFYSNLLKKASQEDKNKSLQLGYISAFIIGEIFLSLHRNLKPFNPIIGETYEYFDNENNIRYYSEQVSHNPQITAFIGETPDFALYGDTNNSTSFKILKGAMELLFKNKVHLHIKSTNEHFVYNRPNILIKGFLNPPLHNDYSGTTIIENESFPENKAEIKFIEESWTNSVLGLFEGKITCGDEVKYLIKGNWNNNIYLIDSNDNNKKIDLLTIDENQEYLKNGKEGEYKLPTLCYDLNYIVNNTFRSSLPGNDSRFRVDMSFLEQCPKSDEAQALKEKYEEKQRKELNNENHKILFFDEKLDENDEKYYIPNGQYWEMKKNGKLQNNCNSNIFELNSDYFN